MKTKILFLQIAMLFSIGIYGQKTEMIDDVYFKPGSKSILNNNDVKSKKVVKQQGKYLNGAKEIIFVDRDTVEIVTPDSKYLLAKANDSTELSQNNEDENGGRYLNEFNGSQSDLEYAERIRRFHNPKYTIFIGDPNYSDIYFLNNFDWNVYVDGSYAYVTPTWTNPYWFDYMYRPYSYNSWYWGNSWYSPYSCYGGWGYNNWGSPFYGGWGYNYWGNPYYGSWGYPYYGYGYGYGYGNYGWGYPYYGYNNQWGSGYTNNNMNRRNDPMNNDANRRIAGTSRSNQGVSHRMEAITIGGGGSRTSYSNRNTYTSLSSSNSRTVTGGNNSGIRSEAGTSGILRGAYQGNTRTSSIRSTADGFSTNNTRNSGYSTNDNTSNRSDYSTPNRGTYNSSSRQTYNTTPRTGNISNGSSTSTYRSSAGSTAPRTSFSTGTPTRTYTESSSSSRNTYQNNSVSSSRSSGPVNTPSYSGSSGSSSSGSSSSSSSGGSRSSGGGGGGRR